MGDRARRADVAAARLRRPQYELDHNGHGHHCRAARHHAVHPGAADSQSEEKEINKTKTGLARQPGFIIGFDNPEKFFNEDVPAELFAKQLKQLPPQLQEQFINAFSQELQGMLRNAHQNAQMQQMQEQAQKDVQMQNLRNQYRNEAQLQLVNNNGNDEILI